MLLESFPSSFVEFYRLLGVAGFTVYSLPQAVYMNCNDGCDNHEDYPCQCCLQSVDDDVSISRLILDRKYIRQNQCDGCLNFTGDTIIYEYM